MPQQSSLRATHLRLPVLVEWAEGTFLGSVLHCAQVPAFWWTQFHPQLPWQHSWATVPVSTLRVSLWSRTPRQQTPAGCVAGTVPVSTLRVSFWSRTPRRHTPAGCVAGIPHPFLARLPKPHAEVVGPALSPCRQALGKSPDRQAPPQRDTLAQDLLGRQRPQPQPQCDVAATPTPRLQSSTHPFQAPRSMAALLRPCRRMASSPS